MSMPAELVTSQVDLKHLLQGFADAPALRLSGICSDSRHVRQGDAFFALQGAASHGLDYLQQVVDAGVVAIIWDAAARQFDLSHVDVPVIAVNGLDGYIGEIANRWFDAPSAAMRVTAVTGTNGKTTVAWMLAQCLRALQHRSAYIGTLGAGIDSLVAGSGLTTPPCIELHGLLAEFRAAGASFAALEVSSHALLQDRVAGIHFDSALFTNLSRDHIDYHGDMHSYGETKARLFLENDLQHRVVCIDTEFGKALAERCPGTVVTVTATGKHISDDVPYVALTNLSADRRGSRVTFRSSWGSGEFGLRLPGDFNAANAGLVLALLASWGVSPAVACDALAGVAAPPGRMQRVEHNAPPAVYVDYAHTPAGLQAALRALRPHCRGKLWCVFGCGGDRDRGKRQEMGAAASRLADCPVVTSDNPRSENPEAIIAEILQGMPGTTTVIEDRAAAIAYAIGRAADDDVILIAGKGHEDYQIVGAKRLPFSDYQTAFTNLAAREPSTGKRQ